MGLLDSLNYSTSNKQINKNVMYYKMHTNKIKWNSESYVCIWELHSPSVTNAVAWGEGVGYHLMIGNHGAQVRLCQIMVPSKSVKLSLVTLPPNALFFSQESNGSVTHTSNKGRVYPQWRQAGRVDTRPVDPWGAGESRHSLLVNTGSLLKSFTLVGFCSVWICRIN